MALPKVESWQEFAQDTMATHMFLKMLRAGHLRIPLTIGYKSILTMRERGGSTKRNPIDICWDDEEEFPPGITPLQTQKIMEKRVQNFLKKLHGNP